METSDWPPSNYPIFFALVLLAATAVTLAMGNESRAEELAIYAYYLLVIGVTIRFFEISLPDDAPEKIEFIKSRILKLTGVIKYKISKHTGKTVSTIVCKVQPLGNFITGFKPGIRPAIKKTHLMHIHGISKDVSIYLFVLFLLLSVYGSIYGWWIIRGYLENLALIIIGFFAVYLLLGIILKQLDKI